MIPENNTPEENDQLNEMNYNPQEDIFNKEEPVPIDGDGNPILNDNSNDGMPYGLDIPGSEDDDNFEQITDQIPDEENVIHTTIGNEDDSEETNEDLIP